MATDLPRTWEGKSRFCPARTIYGTDMCRSGQLSFVTTTVFGTGEAPTVTITALASTVTQQVTMTMMQMIACGTPLGAAVPASEAAAVASSAVAVTQVNSVFTSGAAQLASTAVVVGVAPAASVAISTPASGKTSIVASW